MKYYAIGRSTNVTKKERYSFFSYDKTPVGDKDITHALRIEQVIIFKELSDALKYAREKSKIDDVKCLDYFKNVPLVIEITIGDKNELQPILLEIIPSDKEKRTQFQAYIMNKNLIHQVYGCHYLTGSHKEEKTLSIQASRHFSMEINDDVYAKQRSNCCIL